MRLLKIIVVLLMFGTGIALGQSNYITLESELKIIQFQLDSLSVLEKNITSPIDSSAEEISSLKAQESLNYFERRRLENLLKESQELVQEQQKLQSNILTYQTRYQVAAEDLIHQYSVVIDSLFMRLDLQSPTLLPEEKSVLLEQAQSLREKRDVLIEELSQRTKNERRDIVVAILPGDTPREIEEKADYLNDQEDKLRQQVVELLAKAEELRDEANLRSRMSEFLDDIRLFDQREESASPSGGATAPGIFDSNDRTSEKFLALYNSDGSAAALLPLSDQLLGMDFTNMPSADLDEIIVILESQSQQVLKKADSLRTQAEMFRQQAQTQRENRPMDR